MPRGSKAKYTGKQKRKARNIAQGYERRGISVREAMRRAWATINRESGGGKKSGSGRGRKASRVSSRKGGRFGGRAAARSRSARKGARRRRGR
jgi:plasmid stabilization system protein ParE